jgi:hypothetical protein
MSRKKITYEINSEDLVPLRKAVEKLGYSTSTMKRRIESGDWVEGLHWVNDAAKNAKCRKILVNIKEVNKLRTVSASFR